MENWVFFSPWRVKEYAEWLRKVGWETENAGARMGTAVTNPPCILKTYVSWYKQTFPLRVSAGERRAPWRVLNTSTVSDYHFFKMNLLQRQDPRIWKICYVPTWLAMLSAMPNHLLLAIFFSKTNKVSSDSAVCLVKRLPSWDNTHLLPKEKLSWASFLADGFAEPDFLISGNEGLCTPGSNINLHNLQQKHKPRLLVNCVVWHLKLQTVCFFF